MPENCPLCGRNPISSETGTSPPAFRIGCEWCGSYWMSDKVPATCKSPHLADVTWKLAAYVREKTLQGFDVVLFPDQKGIPTTAPKGSVGIDFALDAFPTSVAERLDRVLLNFDRLTQHLGHPIPLRQENFALLFSKNTTEMMFVLRHLTDAGLLAGFQSTIPCSVTLTGTGFARVADLNRGLLGASNRQVFVAMSFDPSLNDAFSTGLKLGIEDAGYEPLRVDTKEHNNKICDTIVAEIRNSRFLVADFTLHRGGVYFEAGLMMGLGRPVIFTCRSDDLKGAHFDTRQYNHIGWDTPTDLRHKLKRRIQATIPS